MNAGTGECHCALSTACTTCGGQPCSYIINVYGEELGRCGDIGDLCTCLTGEKNCGAQCALGDACVVLVGNTPVNGTCDLVRVLRNQIEQQREVETSSVVAEAVAATPA